MQLPAQQEGLGVVAGDAGDDTAVRGGIGGGTTDFTVDSDVTTGFEAPGDGTNVLAGTGGGTHALGGIGGGTTAITAALRDDLRWGP